MFHHKRWFFNLWNDDNVKYCKIHPTFEHQLLYSYIHEDSCDYLRLEASWKSILSVYEHEESLLMDLWRRLFYFPVYYYIKNASEPKQHVALADITTIALWSDGHKHNWFVNHVSIPRVGKFVFADFVPLFWFWKGTRSISNSNIRDSQIFEGGSLPTMTKSFCMRYFGENPNPYHSEILETIKKITTPLKEVLTNSPWAKTPVKSLKWIGTTTKMTGKKLLLPSQIPLQWWASFQQYQLHSERPHLNIQSPKYSKAIQVLYIYILKIQLNTAT